MYKVVINCCCENCKKFRKSGLIDLISDVNFD